MKTKEEATKRGEELLKLIKGDGWINSPEEISLGEWATVITNSDRQINISEIPRGDTIEYCCYLDIELDHYNFRELIQGPLMPRGKIFYDIQEVIDEQVKLLKEYQTFVNQFCTKIFNTLKETEK